MKKIPYSKIKNSLKTGDLILFSGQYRMSKFVEWLEGSKWSHVTMVVRLPGFDEPLLYEATDLINLPDLLENDYITGPKVVDLKKRLETYGDDVVPYSPPLYAVRRLIGPEISSETEIVLSILKNLHGLPNPSSKEMFFEVLVGRYLHIKTKMDNITCSGFIAYTYEKLGLLKGTMPINGYVPKDFSTDGKLKLINHTLSDEIVIDITC